MKVIKHGDKLNMQRKCKDCNCVFEYEKNDIRTEYDWMTDDVGIIFQRYLKVAYVIEYVKCPDCGKQIEIRSYRLRDKYIGGLL